MFQEYHLISNTVNGKVIKPVGQAYIGRPVFPPTSETMFHKFMAKFKNDVAPKNFEDITYLPIGKQEDGKTFLFCTIQTDKIFKNTFHFYNYRMLFKVLPNLYFLRFIFHYVVLTNF